MSSRKSLLLSALYGMGLSLALVLGAELRRHAALVLSPLMRFAAWAFLALVFMSAVLLLFRVFYHPAGRVRTTRLPPLRFFATAALLLLSWLPALLAYCPGIIAYDATAQILQVIDGTYSTHHPLVHTLFLGGLVRLGGYFGSYTLGAGLYTLLQMLLLAAIYAHCLLLLQAMHTPRGGVYFALVCLCLYPVHAVMSISSTKDTLFGAITLLLCLQTLQMLREPDAFFGNKKRIVQMIAASVLFLLLRNNALYAWLVLVLALLFALRRAAKRLLALFGGILAAFLLLHAGLTAALHATGGSTLEMLCVPLVQMARVAQSEGDTLPEDVQRQIEAYMPLGAQNPYDAHLADTIKQPLPKDAFDRDTKAFLSLWLTLGKAQPKAYLDAALLLNQGLWDPLDTSHGHVYDAWGTAQHGYLQTKFQRHIDDDRGIRLEQKSFLPAVQAFYEALCSENIAMRSPFTNLLFSPGSALWVLLLCIVLFLGRGNNACALAFLLPLALTLTQLLGPCALTRYAYPTYACLPFALVLACAKHPLKKNA